MNRKPKVISVIILCAVMLILILDSKTALLGTQKGLDLCGRIVIPSLFPFFVVSILLTDALSDFSIPILKPIAKLCKMPVGSEGLLMTGFLGGYPIGAKCVYEAWKRGQLSKDDAHRCLGFCNNAGPAFIFGMCGMLFSDALTVWVLWLIHIVSALCVGTILPRRSSYYAKTISKAKTTLTQAMAQGVTAMIAVCSWVIFFRVIISFAQYWFLWLLPPTAGTSIIGITELANGCTELLRVDSEDLRFILCSVFLSLGGLCVGLQTISVVGELGTGMYFPGKIIQCIISCCLSVLFVTLKYKTFPSSAALLVTLISVILIWLVKKTVAFHKTLVYNEEKDRTGGFLCYFGRKLQDPAAIVPGEQKLMTNRCSASKKVSFRLTENAANSFTILANESPPGQRL